MSFLDLHAAIQMACGWQNSHLFTFRTPGRRGEEIAGIPDDDGFLGDLTVPDASQVRLADYFGEGKATTCLYKYDFGDSWEHEVKLKEIVEYHEAFTQRLLGGKRAFPPEDCGGIDGYEDCLRMLKRGRDSDGLKEWLGDWDPEDFQLEKAAKAFDIPRLSKVRFQKA